MNEPQQKYSKESFIGCTLTGICARVFDPSGTPKLHCYVHSPDEITNEAIKIGTLIFDKLNKENTTISINNEESINTKPQKLDEDQKEFIYHLEKAAQIVSQWPKWQRDIFGKYI